MGESGEYSEYVQQLTGASVNFLPVLASEDGSTNGLFRAVEVSGPLMSIYAAHLLLMKKAVDIQWKQGQAVAMQHLEDLRAKVTELESQLAAARAELKKEEEQHKEQEKGCGRAS